MTAIVSATIRIASGFSQATVTLAVTNAIIDYINTLPVGQILYISQIEKAIMNVAGVTSIEPGSLVCGQADGSPTVRTVYRTSNIHVSVTTY